MKTSLYILRTIACASALTTCVLPALPQSGTAPTPSAAARSLADFKTVATAITAYKAYLKEKKSGGHTETDVIIQSIEMIRDVVELMGDQWWEVVKLSIAEKKPYGQVLAQLALDGLKQHSKKR